MTKLRHLIFLPFLAIGLLGEVSAEVGNQLCYPGDNITDSKSIRKPTLDFWHHYWGNVRSPVGKLLFGHLELPKTNITHCHPFTEELTNLLIQEYQFSLMKIVSDVEIIDDNPWWCKDYGTLNHPQPFDKEKIQWWEPSHVCYPKDWTDGIGKFMCDTQQWDQIILKIQKEIIWRCVPFEFWCRDINSYNLYLDIIIILVCFGILTIALTLIMKGIVELLVNRFDPYPGIGPILPITAPAA